MLLSFVIKSCYIINGYHVFMCGLLCFSPSWLSYAKELIKVLLISFFCDGIRVKFIVYKKYFIFHTWYPKIGVTHNTTSFNLLRQVEIDYEAFVLDLVFEVLKPECRDFPIRTSFDPLITMTTPTPFRLENLST